MIYFTFFSFALHFKLDIGYTSGGLKKKINIKFDSSLKFSDILDGGTLNIGFFTFKIGSLPRPPLKEISNMSQFLPLHFGRQKQA